MKFTDGNWLLQPGVNPHYATAVELIRAEASSLTIDASCRPLRHRGDTLGGPHLTVRLDSPMADVVRVRVEHFTGGSERGPHLPLSSAVANPVAVACSDSQDATLRAGALVARISRRDGWMLAFEANGHRLTSIGAKGLGHVLWDGHGAFTLAQLALGVGECVYGLGERFTAFVKNGQTIESWNRDGGTGSEQAYKSVPFYLTNRGYGVLVNELGPVSFEIATERVSRVQFSTPGQSLEFLVLYGPSPKQVLHKLTALTGRPALPPPWSFGLWLSTSFTTDYDEATVMRMIDGMREREIPLHVFHFDCFWMRACQWCDFEWDSAVFPDPAGMLRRLRERGLRICLWINPYIAQRSPLFAEGRRHGYFLRRSDGTVWQTDLWQPGMAIVDFTHPGAAQWFTDHLRRLLALGVDCFKTDFGERIPTDVVYHDGSDPQRMHNYYSVLYNQTVFRLLEETRGRGEAVVFARSSTVSGQRFPAHWGGDCDSTFESMAESLRGGLSLGLCGFGFWSHDIGGFEGSPPAALYKRWIAFGLLSSHSRLHGSTSYRVPWHFDEESCEVLRHFTRLKCRLMPYLWSVAREAAEHGIPMMRAMLLEFPDDPGCDCLDRQYMLGGALLVAPVFSDNGPVDYYLPAGRWTHLLSGAKREGGRWHRETFDYFSLPLYVRAGSILPIGSVENRPTYDYARGISFRAYEIREGATAHCRVPAAPGSAECALSLQRAGPHLHVAFEGPADADWSLEIPGVFAAAESDGAPIATTAHGIHVQPRPGARALSLRLASTD